MWTLQIQVNGTDVCVFASASSLAARLTMTS